MDSRLLTVRLPDALPAQVGVEAVTSTLAGFRVSDAEIRRAAVVVGELIEEARSREAFDVDTAPVEVQISTAGDSLLVQVRDRRMPDVGAASSSRLSWKLAALGFVDELRYSVESDGNVAACEIAIPFDDTWMSGETLIAEDSAVVDDATAEGYVVRRATPQDAEQIVRLTFRTYGYTYVNRGMYSVKALQEELDSDYLTSVVVQARDGLVVGHASVDSSGGDVAPELGRAMVDPRWRGRHLAEQLASALVDVARGQGRPSLWAECVANHLASQRLMLQLGGVECGLLIGAGPTNVTMSRMRNELSGRMTFVPYAIPLVSGVRRTSFLPEHHWAMYADVVERLGLEREVVDSTEPGTGDSIIETHVHAGLQTGRVCLTCTGPETTELVAQEFRAMMSSGLAVLYLDVILAHVGAANAIRIAEANGFFWAALLPEGHPDGDVLRLQRIGWVGVDTGAVQFASDFGRAMADYVLAERARIEMPAH